MIKNTIYTSNSKVSNLYASSINSFIFQTLQNVQNRQNKLFNRNTSKSYDEMLKLMQQTINNEVEDTKKSTADMTMEEYKSYFAEEIKKISFDSSRSNDDEVIQISNAGWKKMKSDPSYESWVMDQIASSRQTKNQLANIGFGGSYYILNFGDKKSDFKSQTWVKDYSRLDNFFNSTRKSTSSLATSLFRMTMNQKLQTSLENAFTNVKYYY